MSTITKLAGRAKAFFLSRAGAMMLFILSCAICASTFSSYFERVDISVGGETLTVVTVRQDGREIIDQAGLALGNDDEFTVMVDAQTRQTDIEILRAFEVTVIEAGTAYSVEIADGNVSDALTKLGIAPPDENDTINYSLEETLFPYMQIILDRVEYVESSETVAVSFKTIKKETDELEKGKTRIAVKGEYGEQVIVTRDIYINGSYASSEVISQDVTKQPVDEVVEVGTAAVQTTTAPTTTTTRPSSSAAAPSSPSASGNQFVDANGRVISYSKVLTGSATAYTANPGALTSTGRPVEMGLVAVDPSVIPYGSNLYIVSADGRYVYGYALAADTGSAVRSGKVLVDLFYDTESQCLAFGRREVIVYILD